MVAGKRHIQSGVVTTALLLMMMISGSYQNGESSFLGATRFPDCVPCCLETGGGGVGDEKGKRELGEVGQKGN